MGHNCDARKTGIGGRGGGGGACEVGVVRDVRSCSHLSLEGSDPGERMLKSQCGDNHPASSGGWRKDSLSVQLHRTSIFIFSHGSLNR